jgi:hypothetical protein
MPATVLNTEADLDNKTLATVEDGLVRRAIVTLTNAQIKALPTTPITLVAAPGAGSRIKVLAATVIAKTGSGAYGNINATYAALQLESAGGRWLAQAVANDDALTTPLTRLSSLLGGTNESYVDMLVPFVNAVEAEGASGSEQWVAPVISNDLTDTENDLVRVSIDNNGSGDLTGGHGSNTLRVIVYYAVEATS